MQYLQYPNQLMKPQINKYSILFTALLSLFVLCMPLSGCRLLKHDKRTQAEKKQQAEAKKADAEYAKACKQHMKNQSDAAKKMMKRTKKKAAKFNKPFKHLGKSKTKCST